MIVKNRLVLSGFLVYTFWYVLLFLLLSWRHGIMPIWIVTDYPLSLFVIGCGAGAGLLLTFGATAIRMHKREAIVRHGDSLRGANSSLGELPRMPVTPAAHLIAAERHLETMHHRKWWALIAREHPAHAEALNAVMRVLATEPKLPASPVPGGHGGRTLIEHSLTVVDSILKMGRDWRYTGQRTRQGELQVGLMDTSKEYHAFGRADIGLLALAGLAHDIGKLACYKPTGKSNGRTVPVAEVKPNHDTEGSKLLRCVPEIFALPYQDRRALLLAVGFYHHAGSISLAENIDDRMRSLTELLIAADVAAGVAEGATQAEAAAAKVEAELESEASQAPISAPAKPEKPKTLLEDPDLPRELSLFLKVLSDPNAIGADVSVQMDKIGYKYGGRLWLKEVLVMAKLPSLPDITDVEIYSTYKTADDTPTPFSRALLAQLADRNLLERKFEGKVYPPARAMFNVQVDNTKKSTIKDVFIIDANILPSTARLPDGKKMEIVGARWKDKSAKNSAQASLPGLPTAEESAAEDSGFTDPDTEPTPAKVGEQMDLVIPTQAVPAPQPAIEEHPSQPAASQESSPVQEPVSARQALERLVEFLTAASTNLERRTIGVQTYLIIPADASDLIETIDQVKALVPDKAIANMGRGRAVLVPSQA